PKSKRVPVRLRHKIEKASTAKQRKERKLAKENPEWRTRLKKDPGIPNLFPYEEKMLQEIEASKRRKDQEKAGIREEDKTARKQPEALEDAVSAGKDEEPLDYGSDEADQDDEDMGDDSANPMAALLASARARA
ncbi:hypothetical protein LTS18_009392, partial [Coniosporium uncinatum]